MIGELVPVVMLPRFTSYVGPGTFATAPLGVEAFSGGEVTFWRGPLVGGAATSPFTAYLEESHDALVWTLAFPTAVTQVNRSDSCAMPFTKRWFRVRVVLAANASGVVGISLWMAGAFVRRVA